MSTIIPLNIKFNYQGIEQELTPTIIANQSRLLLVDVPYPDQLHLLIQALKNVGKSIEEVTDIVITHHDIDHMGCLAEIKSLYPTINIISSITESKYISGEKKSQRLEQAESIFHTLPDEAKPGAIQFQESLSNMQCVKVDTLVSDTDSISGFDDLKVISTPGHTAGHISLWHSSSCTLITGDALVVDHGHLIIANPHFTLDLIGAIESIKKLYHLSIKKVICYHGGEFDGDIFSDLDIITK